MVLLSSHSRYRSHSTFANREAVKKREPEPIVVGYNGRERVELRCRIEDAMREGGVLISEGHWVDSFVEGIPTE